MKKAPSTSRNDQPTNTAPGSEERLAVIARRVAARQPVDHPLDDNQGFTQGLAMQDNGNGKPFRVGTVQLSAQEVRNFLRLPHTAAELFLFLRQRAGLSQVDAAIRAGVSRRSYQLYELGKLEPSLSSFLRLLAAVEVTVAVAGQEWRPASP